jgi:SAM-dependent methyltransferase
MEDVKEAIRRRYSAVARQALQGQGDCGCCCPQPGDSPGAGGEELPQAATQSFRGCGDPVALAELRPGEVVLDIGCGGGRDLILAARRVGPGGHVIGLDANPDMLALAEANLAQAGVTNARPVAGEMEAIPLPDASVDVILSNCVINLSLDKGRALAEAFRVLRPGGRLAVADMAWDGDPARLPAALRQDREQWAGCVAGALSLDEYRRHLAAAGFTGVEIASSEPYAVVEGVALVSARIRARTPGAGS